MIGEDKLFGLIATCEKGNMNMTLTVEKAGGHASNPSKPSAAAIMGKALVKLDKHPMPSKWTPATKQTFKLIAPHVKFPFRFILVNRDILSPLLKFVFKKFLLPTRSFQRRLRKQCCTEATRKTSFRPRLRQI